MKKKPPKILDYFVLIYDPKHQRSVGEGYVPEQVLVAEKVLGRSLSADEDVRHINGNPHDNRPANLEIISSHADYRSQVLDDSVEIKQRKSTGKTFVPCRYQRPCWKNIRSKIAKENGVYLSYICSFQTEGDIYKCSRWWNFFEQEMQEKKNEEARGSV